MRAIVKNELVMTREEREVISNFVHILEDNFRLDISENTEELAEIIAAIDMRARTVYISECGNNIDDIDIKYID